MRKPRALRPGDEIRVVSPASALKPESIEDGVHLLESAGYRVTLGEHVFDQDGYLAGADEARAADLNEAFSDPDVAGIVCSRGGYGCARLIPHLDLDSAAESGKVFCGFSDVTTLHLALNARGLVTLHTPMLITLSVEREPWVHRSFLNLLKGDANPPEDAWKAETVVGGSATGVVTGGCLCLIGDSVGTDFEIETKDKILLIEDVDEHPHRVDAMLTHLLNCGKLRSAAAVVFGEMTNTDGMSDPKIGAWPWRRIVEDRVAGLEVPIAVGFPFGHMKQMLSVPMGLEATFDADAGRLTFEESACEA